MSRESLSRDQAYTLQRSSITLPGKGLGTVSPASPTLLSV